MRRRRHTEEPKPTIPLAPLIDCVFLLLAYFVVTSNMERPEGDLEFQLPGVARPGERVSVPEEVVIGIGADGVPEVNGQRFDLGRQPRNRSLAALLARFAAASRAGGEEPVVTIEADDATRQEAIIQALDAAAWAGVTQVRFGIGDDG